MDLLWLDDMTFDAQETTTSQQEVEQDCLHVVIQDLGSNADDPDRGLGVGNSLSAPLDPGLVAKAEDQIAQQNDDRVSSCTATITQDTSDGISGQATLNLTINLNDATLSSIDLQVPIGTSTLPAA